jgi:hypothetical protein
LLKLCRGYKRAVGYIFRATNAGCMRKDRRKQERLSGVNNVNQKLPFSIAQGRGKNRREKKKDSFEPNASGVQYTLDTIKSCAPSYKTDEK